MPQREAAQIVLGVRRVHGDYVKVLELGSEHASFFRAIPLPIRQRV